MTEATLDRKRKIVEISLPHFTWKSFLSKQFFIFCSCLTLCSVATYWFLVVRPFLWISSGHINAVSVFVPSLESGAISMLPVQEGERVEKGQLLFSFESRELINEQKKIQADAIEWTKQLQGHQRLAENAMQDYLGALGVKPQDEIDLYLQTLQEEQTKTEELQREISLIDNRLREIQVRLDKSVGRAPFDGIVLKQQKGVGDSVQIGDRILSLFDLNRSWIEVTIPEKNLHLIEIGQLAKIRLAAYPSREWVGAVAWIGPATVSKIEGKAGDSLGEEIVVKISLPKENFPLRPGLSSSVGIKVH